MITISQLLEEIVKNSPILSENLTEGLINYSSLARKLRPELEDKLYRDITLGSIVMALKRLKLPHASTKLSAALAKITDISVRSDLVALTFDNSPTLFANQSKLLEAASKTPNSFLTISNGIHETSIFTNKSLSSEAEKIFKNEAYRLKTEHLSSITLMLPEEAVDTPGIHYSVFKKLYANGVNVFDTATSYTELTIFMHSEEVEKAFGVLKRLV